LTVSLVRSDRVRSWKFQPTPLRVGEIGAILKAGSSENRISI
jgi:hypothetical protein